MLVNLDDCLLLVVDVQVRLIEKIHKKKELIFNIKRLINVFNTLKLPIIITEQYPQGLGVTIDSINKDLASYDKVEKTTFSCLSETKFKKLLSFPRFILVLDSFCT